MTRRKIFPIFGKVGHKQADATPLVGGPPLSRRPSVREIQDHFELKVRFWLRWTCLVIDNITLKQRSLSNPKWLSFATWTEIPLNRCKIPVRLHVSVHKRGIHKWTHFCMFLGLRSASCNMYCRAPGEHRIWGKCIHLLLWGSGILCKPECYTDLSLRNLNLNTLQFTFCPEKDESPICGAFDSYFA